MKIYNEIRLLTYLAEDSLRSQYNQYNRGQGPLLPTH